MALLDFFEINPDRDDPAVRLLAIKKLSPDKDQEKLIAAVSDDPELEVRKAALDKISDPVVLRDLLHQSLPDSLTALCHDKLDHHYSSLIITPVTGLEEKYAALEQIKAPAAIADLIVSCESAAVRLKAIDKIDDHHLLAQVTRKNCGKTAGMAIVDKLSDCVLLAEIGTHAANKKVRHYAEEKCTKIKEKIHQPSPEELRAQEFEKLINSASLLAETWNWEYGETRFDEIRQAWHVLDPQGDHRGRAEIDHAATRFQQRKQEFMQRQLEEKIQLEQKSRRFESCHAICQQLLALIASDADLDRQDEEFQLLKNSWKMPADLYDPDFVELEKQFTDSCQRFQDKRRHQAEINAQRQARMRELEQLCVEAEELLAHPESEPVKNVAGDLDHRWRHASKAMPNIEPLAARFSATLEQVESRAKAWAEKQHLQRQQARDRLEQLCELVEAQITATDHTQTVRIVRESQQELTAVVNIADSHDPLVGKLIRRFRKGCDTFYKKQHEFQEQKGWEEWANLVLKEELCAAVDALAQENDGHVLIKKIKEAQQEWKKIGPIPRDKADAIWQLFKSLCDREYERTQVFFAELDRQRLKNLQLKEEICLKVEKLAAGQTFNPSSEEIKAIQDEWRKLGPVRKEDVKSIEEKFRTVCTLYFTNRREYFRQLHEEQDRNAQAKKELCIQAEKIVQSPDWDRFVDEMKGLQAQWKKTGMASWKKESALWGEFSQLCDQYFEKLHSLKPENKARKDAVITEIKEITAKLRNSPAVTEAQLAEANEQVMELQRQWRDIGLASRDEEKILWAGFQHAGDEFFNFRRQFTHELHADRDLALKRKQQLLDQIESLSDSSDWQNSEEIINQIDREWQEIGCLSMSSEPNLQSRYQAAHDQFFLRKKMNFGELRKEQMNLIRKKEELCVRLELLVKKGSSTNSNDNLILPIADQLKLAFEANFIVANSQREDPMQQWHVALDEVKKIEHSWAALMVQPDFNDSSLDERFRRALDNFYTHKPKNKRFDQGEEFNRNREIKLRLCEQVEALAANENPQSVIDKVKRCQQEWKKTGMVTSKGEADRLWARFSQACDTIYTALRGDANDVTSRR